MPPGIKELANIKGEQVGDFGSRGTLRSFQCSRAHPKLTCSAQSAIGASL